MKFYKYKLSKYLSTNSYLLYNRCNAVVRRNIKKNRQLEPHERKYLNITNVSYMSYIVHGQYNGVQNFLSFFLYLFIIF